MAAYRPDVTRISENAIFELQKQGRAIVRTLSRRVIYQKWRPVTGSGCEITYISACMRDINDIPTAIPLFTMSNNTTGLF